MAEYRLSNVSNAYLCAIDQLNSFLSDIELTIQKSGTATHNAVDDLYVAISNAKEIIYLCLFENIRFNKETINNVDM